MTGLGLRSITDVSALVRGRALSAVDLVRDALARAESRPELNAFTLLMREAALAEAERADREIASGRYRGALHGIPITVKDLIDVAGTPTTAGSRVPAGIAAADAPSVRRLRDAGAVIIGKTNLHEFAFGTTSDETAFGAGPQPDRSFEIGGRVERRVCRSGGRRHVLRLGGHRYRRFHPHSCRRLRHRWTEAVARRDRL